MEPNAAIITATKVVSTGLTFRLARDDTFGSSHELESQPSINIVVLSVSGPEETMLAIAAWPLKRWKLSRDSCVGVVADAKNIDICLAEPVMRLTTRLYVNLSASTVISYPLRRSSAPSFEADNNTTQSVRWYTTEKCTRLNRPYPVAQSVGEVLDLVSRP